MKVTVVVFNVLVVTAVVGSTLRYDEDGGDLGIQTIDGSGSKDATAIECRLHDVFSGIKTQVLTVNTIACGLMNVTGLTAGLDNANTSEDYRLVYKTYCSGLPSAVECLGHVSLDAERCLAGNDLFKHKILSEDVQLITSVECSQDGERIATIMEALTRFQRTENSTVGSLCIDNVKLQAQLENPFGSSVDMYRVIRNYMKCVVEKFKGLDDLVISVSAFGNEMLEHMKCFDEEHGKEVLCKSIVHN